MKPLRINNGFSFYPLFNPIDPLSFMQHVCAIKVCNRKDMACIFVSFVPYMYVIRRTYPAFLSALYQYHVGTY